MDEGSKQFETDALDPALSRFRFIKLLDVVTRYMLGIILASVVLLVGTNVAGRYFFGTTFPWMTELARLLFIWLAFLGAVSADLYGEHIAIRAVTDRARGTLSTVLVVFRAFLPLVFYGVLIVAAWGRVTNSTRSSPLLGIPMQWITISLLVAGILLLVIGCLRVMRFRAAFFDGGDSI